MSSKKWATVKLGDVVQVKGGKRLPKETPYTGYKTDHPYIRLVDIQNGRISNQSIQYIDNETYSFISRYIVDSGDVCLAIVGNTIGVVFYVDEHWAGANLTENAARLTNYKDADSKYIYYYLTSEKGQNEIFKNAVGSAQGKLPIYGIQNIDLPLPPISTQSRIADILSALDEKIELNRQTNSTLEAIAQSIFREWFVEFNYPSATGEMVKSELGMIPKGWKILPLDKIADFLNGLALQKFPAENEKDYLPVIKIRELKNGVSSSSDKASRSIQSKYIINDGDLIFSWSGTLEVKFWVGGEGALNQHLFKVTSKEYPLWFCYFWILEHLANFRGIAEDKTTTMGHIQRHHLSEALCYVPDNLTELDKVMKPLVDKVINLEQQSATLASLRDTLLPKLMSGEIDV